MSRSSFFHHWEGFLPPQTIVMGKRSVGEPAAPDLKANAQSSGACFLLSFVTKTEPTSEQAETFRKMVHALGLTSDEFELLVGETEVARGQAVVILDSSQTEWVNERTMKTYSLQMLLDQPTARKSIFGDLKLLLSRLGRSG